MFILKQIAKSTFESEPVCIIPRILYQGYPEKNPGSEGL